jgi:hypothetical protein
MVFYNKEVAKILAKNGKGLLRVHDASEKPAHGAISEYYEKYPALKYMVMNAAKYEVASADSNQEHSMFPGTPYCHATSPIRRYADLVNQRYLKAILFSEQQSSDTSSLAFVTYHLNRRQKILRKLNRDIHFLNVLFEVGAGAVPAAAVNKTISGLCISTDVGGTKIKVYVPAWEKTITIRDYDGAVVGDWLSISYWFNPAEVRWKDKIVFRVNDLIAEPQVE